MKRDHKDPWSTILHELFQQVAPAPLPCKMSLVQLYMGKYKASVDKEVDKCWPTAGLPNTHKLAFWCKIAKKLLERSPQNVMDELEAELEELAAAGEALTAGELGTEENPSASEQELAREGMARVMQPMLDFLRKKTGYYMTLIAGIPNEDGPREFQLKIVTAGKTGGNIPLPWHLVEGDHFKTHIMGSFMHFLSQTEEKLNSGGRELCTDLIALPNSSTSTPALPVLDLLARLPSSSTPTLVPLTKVVKMKNAARKGNTTTAGKKSGTQCRRKASDHESDTAEESESEEEGGEGEYQEDEEEGSEDGQDKGDADRRLLAGDGIPDGAVIPALDELTLHDSVREFFNNLSPATCRQQLYFFSRSTKYERNVFCGRIISRALLQSALGRIQVPASASAGTGAEDDGKASQSKTKQAPSSSATPRRSLQLKESIAALPNSSLGFDHNDAAPASGTATSSPPSLAEPIPERPPSSPPPSDPIPERSNAKLAPFSHETASQGAQQVASSLTEDRMSLAPEVPSLSLAGPPQRSASSSGDASLPQAASITTPPA
ncbi:hypothetical protein LXA43DRAFT_1101181 [Ganoderma leucocontextum]|nr:hypothetical protein LXA43DRAFT_1101181 [Ganoderma leucocontextum]